MTAPHHAPDGRFRDPWPPHPEAERRPGGVLRWALERRLGSLPPDPQPDDIPRAGPDPARPRAAPDDLRLTWIGHATFLVQVGGLNLLTDPVFSRRASPVPWAGPARFTPPGLALDALPPVDAVVLSHDHYDHLDRPTVEALRHRYGPALRWITPLGYRRWFAARGVERVVELDWWEDVVVGEDGGSVRVTCLPARHWTRRRFRVNTRLWSSWAIEGVRPDRGDATGEAEGEGIFFAGDTGWCPAFREIGRRVGPFRASLLPVGAYEPRWFMAPSHMNPEEAVDAWRALGARGALVGMHWGTFRLTDEDPLEPPARTRRAWREAGLPEAKLFLPAVGETISPGRSA